MNCTTESAIYVMELTVIGGVPIKKGGDKIQSFSMSCDSSMIRAHLSEFHLWVLPLVTWIDGFSQPGYCMLHSLG